MPDPRHLSRCAALPAVSAALTGLSLTGLLAAFLLGPMLASAFGAGGADLSVPKSVFLASQAAIGCPIAQTATSDLLRTLIEDGALIIFVVSVTIVAGALAAIVLTRLRVLPGSTAAWGSAPDGAVAMVTLSEAHVSDPRLVAFLQYIKVAAVVLSALLLGCLLGDERAAKDLAAPPVAFSSDFATLAVAAAGAGIALTLRALSGALTRPMLLGLALHAAGLVEVRLPGPMLDAACDRLGWFVGLRFSGETLRTCWHNMPRVLAAAIGVIMLCGLDAYGLTFLPPNDVLITLLATSPSRLNSVVIIAVGAKRTCPSW